MKDIIISSSIYYDPKNDIDDTVIEEDKELLKIYKEFSELEMDESQDYVNSPWIIRIVFDKNIMMEKSIIMEDVYMKLMDYDIDRLSFTYTDDNSKNLIGRISLKVDKEDKKNGIQNQSDIISVISGVDPETIFVSDSYTFDLPEALFGPSSLIGKFFCSP